MESSDSQSLGCSLSLSWLLIITNCSDFSLL